MKKIRAQRVDRTRETAGRKKPAVGKKEEEREANEPIHNGSANAFGDAEGISVEREDEEGEGRRDDVY